MIIEPLFDQMVQVRPAAAYSCNPDGESLLLAAAIPMENPYCSCKLTRSGRTEPLRRGAPACGHHALARDAGESRPTAAIPMDNPYCSCKLTRVRSRCRRTSTSSTSPPRTWTRSSASSPPRSSRGPSPCTPLYQPPAVIKHGLSSNVLALITSGVLCSARFIMHAEKTAFVVEHGETYKQPPGPAQTQPGPAPRSLFPSLPCRSTMPCKLCHRQGAQPQWRVHSCVSPNVCPQLRVHNYVSPTAC